MKKPIKLAAYSYIILLILGLITGFFYSSYIPLDKITSFGLILQIANFIFATLAIYGFIVIGKKYKNQLLINISWIGIIFLFIYVLYIVFGSLIINVPQIPQEATPDMIMLTDFLIFAVIIHIIYSIVFGIQLIIFGIALLKLKNKLKYSKISGILNIISGATLIIFIGYLIGIAAIITEILMLFEASKKLEG